uniref:CUB domain-containing protein n=1 Tax=Syphacia muris TaxID=451379 RepID=A0A0N5AS87_9BILA
MNKLLSLKHSLLIIRDVLEQNGKNLFIEFKKCELSFYAVKQESFGCGGIYYASSVPTELSHKMGTYIMKDDMEYCYWWIVASYDVRIEVEIRNLSAPCWEGCLFGGLEIKGALDKRLTGYRFCCTEIPVKRIIAPGGILPIIAYNRDGFTSFTVQYRTVPNDQKTTEEAAEEFMQYGIGDYEQNPRQHV